MKEKLKDNLKEAIIKNDEFAYRIAFHKLIESNVSILEIKELHEQLGYKVILSLEKMTS